MAKDVPTRPAPASKKLPPHPAVDEDEVRHLHDRERVCQPDNLVFLAAEQLEQGITDDV
jgi:hypothetical protein